MTKSAGGSGFVRILWLIGVLGLFQLPSTIAQTPLYINCGGSSYTDPSGIPWQADQYFNLGSSYTTGREDIELTNKDLLYRVERYGAGNMYSIPVTPGVSYDITLHFAEIYFNEAEKRIFHVDFEGTRRISNLDVFAAAGGAFRAIQRTVTGVVAPDGILDISLTSVRQNPAIKGIAIVPSSTPPPTGFTKLINAGGSSYTDSQGNVWESDEPYKQNGTPYSTNNRIADTNMEPLYQLERYGKGLMYTIPNIPNGFYDVTLKFAEIYFGSAETRVFDVQLNGNTVIRQLDIFKEVGSFRKLDKVIRNVEITQQKLDVSFPADTATQNPKIQGIAIRSTSGGPNPTTTPPPPPPGGYSKYINCGGSDYDDGTNIWEDDRPYYNLGSSYSTSNPIGNTLKDPLYQVERYGEGLMYTIRNIPIGTYDIALHFAEIYFPNSGSRVFDVKLNNNVIASELDIVKEVGSYTALIITALNFPINGVLDITLTRGDNGRQNPKINGIEIVQASGSSPTTTPAPPPAVAQWIDLNEDQDYTARHECSFVQAGKKFYLFGGRENPRTMDTYDYETNNWTRSASAPEDFNHFQAVEYQGLIWVIGAFRTNNFPNEQVEENVHVFDPANNVWMLGPSIPAARRRGGGGLQEYNGKFYLVGGNNMGHNDGAVPWLDEYDPRTGEWRVLPDAPRRRDHFHAAVLGNRLYAAGGRRSSANTGGDDTFRFVIPEVDVYDFSSNSWLSSRPDDLPDPRAAAITVAFKGKILLAGGESLRSGDAHVDTHELNPSTGRWERVDNLNYGRHGTQGIVSGQGVYVVAGSDNRGGGNQKNMEVYNANLPSGGASSAGSLAASSSVDIPAGTPTAVSLRQTGGNQGIFVNAMSISGPNASDFSITSGFPTQILIPNGATHNVFIRYSGSQNGAEAQLTVVYSGSQVRVVTLRGTTSSSTSPLDIVDFVIVNAATNTDIRSANGCNGCVTSSTSMSIRAVPRGTVGSVRLVLSGPVSRTQTESVAPYTLFGDSNGNYNGQMLTAGTYTIRAQAYSLSGLGGTAGNEAIATFTVAP